MENEAQRRQRKITEAIDILSQFGLPRDQQNERTAYCLLALLNVPAKKNGKTPKLRLSASHR